MTETVSPRHMRHDFARRDTPARPEHRQEGAGQILAKLDAAPVAG